MEQYEQSFGAQVKCTPIQCKNGPLEQRKCTDFFCCFIYLLLIGVVIAFAILSANALKISRSQLQQELSKTQYGTPFVALTHSYFEICLAILCVIALCLIMIIVTFLIPVFVTYLFIPIGLLLTLIIGLAFIYIYFGNTLPFVSAENQAQFIQQRSLLALGIGILLLATFVFILFVMITRRLRLSKIVNVLKIARVFFWQNCYTIFVSFGLSILSLVIWYLNILFLQISQDRKDSQHYIDSRIMTLIIIIEILWTHGIMQGLSDFLFESFAINWYFNNTKYGEDYSKIGRNCCPSLGLVCRHFGTIVFGWILAYIPEQINAFMRRFQQNCTCCYNLCCFCHKITIRKFSKYGYCQTILQSMSFCQANDEMFELKKRTKSTLPQLYMQGNFFMTICKTLILMFSLIVVYFLLIQQNQQYYFNSVFNLLIPLIVTLFASSEICNHFLNVTGLVGDTIVFMYTVDIEIEKKNYGATQPYSCPQEVRQIIRESRNSDIAYQY